MSLTARSAARVLMVSAVVGVAVPPSPAAAGGSDQTGSCGAVFTGDQGALVIEAPRYAESMVVTANGDGSYTVPYHLVLYRTLGPTYTADRALTCVFVDTDGSGQPDGGEALFGIQLDGPVFGQATSSSVRTRVEVAVAAEPGSPICARAQVDSSYDGTFQDKSQYYCEALPGDGGTPLPGGGLGGVAVASILGCFLVVAQRLGRVRPTA